MTEQKPKRHDGFYYRVSKGVPSEIFQHTETDKAPPESPGAFLYGPFHRFGMAKTDAIRYFEDGISSAREGMARLRAQKETK